MLCCELLQFIVNTSILFKFLFYTIYFFKKILIVDMTNTNMKL